MHGSNVTRGSLAGRVERPEGARELLVCERDLASVALEPERGRSGAPQLFPLQQKPSKEILEGFDWMRLWPPGGGGGGRLGRGM